MTLDQLQLNQYGSVVRINGNCDVVRRFEDLGLIHGTRVKCSMISPLGGIRAYGIRQTLMAIRDQDAARIQVELDL